jgi:hypothetical protein
MPGSTRNMLVEDQFCSQTTKRYPHRSYVRTKSQPSGRFRNHGKLDRLALDSPVDRHSICGVAQRREKGVSRVLRGGCLGEPCRVLSVSIVGVAKVRGRRGAGGASTFRAEEGERDQERCNLHCNLFYGHTDVPSSLPQWSKSSLVVGKTIRGVPQKSLD